MWWEQFKSGRVSCNSSFNRSSAQLPCSKWVMVWRPWRVPGLPQEHPRRWSEWGYRADSSRSFPRLPSGLTLPSRQSQDTSLAQHWQQQHRPVADLLRQSLSDGWDSKRVLLRRVDVQRPWQTPCVMLYEHQLRPGSEQQSGLSWRVGKTWSQMEEKHLGRSRKSLDTNLLATHVWQTSIVIFPRITS